MVRMASEDIGLAEPGALAVTLAAKEAFEFIGPPEGNLALAQAAVYLSLAPKSNALYTAYGDVKEDVRKTEADPVPLHLRNAVTGLDEKCRLRQRLPIRARSRRKSDEHVVLAGQSCRPHILSADGSRFRAADSAAAGRYSQDQIAFIPNLEVSMRSMFCTTVGMCSAELAALSVAAMFGRRLLAARKAAERPAITNIALVRIRVTDMQGVACVLFEDYWAAAGEGRGVLRSRAPTLKCFNVNSSQKIELVANDPGDGKDGIEAVGYHVRDAGLMREYLTSQGVQVSEVKKDQAGDKYVEVRDPGRSSRDFYFAGDWSRQQHRDFAEEQSADSHGMGDQGSRRGGQILQRHSGLPFVLAGRDEGRRDFVGGDAGAEREYVAGVHAEYFADGRPPYAGRYESYFAGRDEHQGSRGAD